MKMHISTALSDLAIKRAQEIWPKGWIADPGYPETCDGIRAAYVSRHYGPFRVSGDHCEDTIYGSKTGNLAFRAWHDGEHGKHSLRLCHSDEIKVARIQTLDSPANLAPYIWADSAGQTIFKAITGEFVAHQAAFVDHLVAFIQYNFRPPVLDFETLEQSTWISVRKIANGRT